MIFVSHSNKADHSYVVELIDKLKSYNLEFWVAPESVLPSEFYAQEITDAIKRCTKFLLVITKDSLQSPHVMKEVELAAHQYHKEVIPILFDEQLELPSAWEYMLCTFQYLKLPREVDLNHIMYQKLLRTLMTESRIYDVQINKKRGYIFTLIRGGYEENMRYLIEHTEIDLECTVFAMGIDRSALLAISSNGGVLKSVCRMLQSEYSVTLEEMQHQIENELCKRPAAAALDLESADENFEYAVRMDYGEIITIRIPVQTSVKKTYLQLMFVANSEKVNKAEGMREVDNLVGRDSREIILKVFKKCAELQLSAENLVIGAMGTNGLVFPYSVITAEILNAFLYAEIKNMSPLHLYYSVRQEDMDKQHVTSTMIYNYIENIMKFF